MLANDSTNHQKHWLIDADKTMPKVNILDAMKMFTISWEHVTEESVQKLFAKIHISAQDQTQAQNNLGDPFIKLRSNIEKLKSPGFDEISKNLSPEIFENFDDTIATTEPVLSE